MRVFANEQRADSKYRGGWKNRPKVRAAGETNGTADSPSAAHVASSERATVADGGADTPNSDKNIIHRRLRDMNTKPANRKVVRTRLRA